MPVMSRLAALLLLLLAVLPLGLARSQELPNLPLLSTQSVLIDADTAPRQWLITTAVGGLYSLRALTTSGDLVPALTLYNMAGQPVATSQQSAHRGSTIEAFTAAESTYRLQVSLPSAGAYKLLFVPGYSYLLVNDAMNANTFMRTWREANASAVITSGQLRLNLRASNGFAWTSADKLAELSTFYASVSVTPNPDAAYWEAGLTLRGSAAGTALDAYRFEVNQRGQWRFALSQANVLTPLSDWAALPSPLSQRFQLAVLAERETFRLFYDGQPLATLSDSTLSSGLIGFVAGALAPPNTGPVFISADFDDLVLTLPAAPSPAMPSAPAQIEAWQGGPNAILAELQAAGLLPGAGRLGFDEDEAFVTNSTNGGIVYVSLARDAAFADLVYAADVAWDTSGPNVACAIELRAESASSFVIIYFDRQGGLGVREIQDNQPISTWYNLTPAINTENTASNHLLVAAIGSSTSVYINGQRVVELSLPQRRGSVNIASYHYGRALSECRYRKIWVRSFDWE
jgi:hypothetical protein